MESQTESLLAAETDSLKISDIGGHPDGSTTIKREEDQFYDCEESLQTETKIPADRTSINSTETSRCVNSDRETGETEHMELTTDESDEDKDSKIQSGAEGSHQLLMNNGAPAEDEYERVLQEEENRTDFDSEVKEESGETVEFDDEYLREAEKNLTEEEKEVSLILFWINARLV